MQNRRVLITAGASGIGRAMGEAFVAAGWNVWVTDIDASVLATCPAGSRADQGDASDEAAVDDLFARIQKHWSGLEVLCANAGIAGDTVLIES